MGEEKKGRNMKYTVKLLAFREDDVSVWIRVESA